MAEGGVGGSHSTVGECEQVPSPVGPYTGSDTGSRISAINRQGERFTVVDDLPSSQTSAALGGFVSGVADIAFLGHKLYALLAGAGCSHGVPDIPNGILEVGWDGHTRITRDGRISRVIDISATEGHVVPSAMAVHAGRFYVGTLTPFPASPVAKVYEITPGGQMQVVAEGLTAVRGVAFFQDQPYVLETSAPAPQPGPPVIPGTGRVVRVTDSGALEPVVTGLTFPTAMTFGPDGSLYISNFGFGFPPGSGEIVRASVGHGRGHAFRERHETGADD